MIQMSFNVLERMHPPASGLPMNVSLNNTTMSFSIDITVNWMYYLYSFVLGSLRRYQLNQSYSSGWSVLSCHLGIYREYGVEPESGP